MRTIKFRAWDVKNGGWIRNNIAIDSNGMKYWLFGHEARIVGIDEYDIEMFTGLKDRNGKEIYEGDILNGSYGEQGENKTHSEVKGTVIFDRGTFFIDFRFRRFPLSNVDGNYSILWRDEQTITRNCWYSEVLNLEVIGNVHESPDLLTPPKEVGA